MKTIVLSGLEAALNKVLRLDPDSMERVQSLKGKSVKLVVSDWDFSCFIVAYDQGLELLSEYHQQPDTVIIGKLFSLMKAGAAKGSTTALFDESITIQGDTHTGEVFRDLLKNLDIDWEEQLSKIIGDTAAHPIADLARKMFDFGKKSALSLRNNLSEYLHYESQQLPPEQAVENFIAEVGEFRNDVDRLEARIHRLSSRKKAS